MSRGFASYLAAARQRFLHASLGLIGLWAAPAWAGGDLMVAPTRVVFDGAARVYELTLVNKGAETATYRISFENKHMTEDGQFEPVETPGPDDRFADPMLRISQRQVTLEPGQPQTLRVLLRKPETLADGEYRSHLLFRGVPTAEAQTMSVETKEGISIALIPIYGVSIPVIVRQGALAAQVGIDKVDVLADASGGGGEIQVGLSRTGDRSVYGDIAVIDPKGVAEDDRVIVAVRGVAVYTPNRHRNLKLLLSAKQMARVRAPGVRVVFRETATTPGALTAEKPVTEAGK